MGRESRKFGVQTPAGDDEFVIATYQGQVRFQAAAPLQIRVNGA
jgi:hypothetical protein